MVTAGYAGNAKRLDSVEALDLTSDKTVCHNLPSYPTTRSEIFGGMVVSPAKELAYPSLVQMVCGGRDQGSVLHSSCYVFANGDWAIAPSNLTMATGQASAVPLPNGGLVIAG